MWPMWARTREARRGRTALAVASAAVVLSLATSSARAQSTSPFRYDDNALVYATPDQQDTLLGRVKYISLGEDAQEYLSFGGDVRERVEMVGNALLGFREREANVYDLNRVLLFADLQYDGFRAFVQLGSHTEMGRAPGAVPTDLDRGDLQQGFADYADDIGAGRLTLRGGRFEMSFDGGALIGLRDGPNVRQTWDGFWGFYVLRDARIDAFAVAPVEVDKGYFDDSGIEGECLWGVHVDLAPRATAPFRFTAFYYGSIMPRVTFSPRPGREETHTVGLRMLATRGAVDGSVGVIGQIGTFAGQDVRAWAAHGDIGWKLSLPWSPRLGLRADVLSGGNNHSGTIHTFNALYPNYAYSTEATIEAPANLMQAGGTIEVQPVRAVTVHYTLEGLWRYSTRDAFYAAPTFALVAPGSDTRRYSGTEQQIEATWHVNPYLDVTAAYVHFAPGDFLLAAHARAENFGMTEFAIHF